MTIRKVLIRVLVVVLTMAVTHLVTSRLMDRYLMAQRPNAKDSAQAVGISAEPVISEPPGLEAVQKATLSRSEAAKAEEDAWTIRPVDPRIPFASRLLKDAITPGAGSLRFQATVKMMDSNPKLQYMWSIRVSSRANPRDRFVRHYDNQLFSMPDRTERIITFDEAIGFEPGQYDAVVSLYKLKPGIDLMKIDDNMYATPFLATRFGGKFTVR